MAVELREQSLRPLSDFFWGWIEHEPMRLNANRRFQEYKHYYGPCALEAPSGVQAATCEWESISRCIFFINLMSLCEAFLKTKKEATRRTVIADSSRCSLA